MLGSRKKTSGLTLGRFIPPHNGHRYLIDFARNYVDSLIVVLGGRPEDTIPVRVREAWLKEMFPDVSIIVVRDRNPDESHPQYWKIWENTLRKALPLIPEYFFASEEYGWKLSEIMGMRYVPVNHPRTIVPISATQIRTNPMKYWEFIPPAVRAYYVKKVCIFGPESTGKSTLTVNLAKHFSTVYCEEYARWLVDYHKGNVMYDMFPSIARGHRASEIALTKLANRVLISDTDMITTTIWSKEFFGKCPSWIVEHAGDFQYDIYLLCDIDVPWVQDGQRYFPTRRQAFFNRCKIELEKRKLPYVIIKGNWQERLQQSITAVEAIIQ